MIFKILCNILKIFKLEIVYIGKSTLNRPTFCSRQLPIYIWNIYMFGLQLNGDEFSFIPIWAKKIINDLNLYIWIMHKKKEKNISNFKNITVAHTYYYQEQNWSFFPQHETFDAGYLNYYIIYYLHIYLIKSIDNTAAEESKAVQHMYKIRNSAANRIAYTGLHNSMHQSTVCIDTIIFILYLYLIYVTQYWCWKYLKTFLFCFISEFNPLLHRTWYILTT